MENLSPLTNSSSKEDMFSDFILESIRDGIISFDLNGVITSANTATQTILDLSVKEIAGKPYKKIFLENNPIYHIIEESLNSKKPYDDLDIIYPLNGKKISLRVSICVNYNRTKEIIGIILIIKDISNLKRIERNIRNERLIAVGRLTGSIAHEIRNPLSAMKINLQLLEEQMDSSSNIPQQEKLLKYIKIIHSEIQRLDTILQNFIRFSRPPSIKYKSVDIHLLLDNILSLLLPEAQNQGIEMEKLFLATNPFISGDDNQLEQVFLNIIINSFQAMPEGGKFQVKTEEELLTNSVIIEFLDTGEGIAPENIDKIFDLYFTTKPEGSGFGLSIALRIIKDHNGTIDVESKKGVGTRFVIKLPRKSGNFV